MPQERGRPAPALTCRMVHYHFGIKKALWGETRGVVRPSEKRWGLFIVDRQPKPVMQPYF